MISVPPQVDQGGASSIRSPKRIDLLVTQRCPHVVEIVRKDRLRILRQIGSLLQLLTAGLQPLRWNIFAQFLLRPDNQLNVSRRLRALVGISRPDFSAR